MVSSNSGNLSVSSDDGVKRQREMLKLAEEKASRGLLFQQQGKLEEAKFLYREALALAPALQVVRYNLGIILHRQGDLAAAYTHYFQAITLNPGDIQARYNMSVVLQQQGLLDKAISSYQKVINLSQTSALNNPVEAKAYSNCGGILVKEGRFEEAVKIFQKAIALKPKDASLYNNLGQAFLEAGKIDRAIQSYSQALQLQPQLTVARYNIGKAYQKQGLHEEAIAYFQQAIQQQPDNISAYSDCGFSLMEIGNLPEAMACFQKAIANNPFIEYNIQIAKFLTKADELQRAKIACAQFIKTLQKFDLNNPNSLEKLSDSLIQTYFHLGNVSFEYGEYRQAEIYYKKALKIQPLKIDLYLELGKSLLKQERFNAAIVVYRMGLALQSKNPDIARELQIALRKQHSHRQVFNFPSIPETSTKEAAWKSNPETLQVNSGKTSSQFAEKLAAKVADDSTVECKGLNCESCLQEIFRQFQPLHLGNNIYSFAKENAETPFSSEELQQIPISGRSARRSHSQARRALAERLFVRELTNARAWIVPQKNAWMVCNAIAIIDENNEFVGEVSREYPGQLPGCQNYGSDKHRIFTAEELPPLEKIDGTVAVLSGLSGNVYFHWMVDILPRIEILRRTGIDFKQIDWFLINSSQQQFQRETLRVLGIPEDKILESDRHPHIQATKLIVPSFPGYLGWLPQWALEFHRKTFLNQLLYSPGKATNAEAVLPIKNEGLGGDGVKQNQINSTYPERIYISRNRARYRRVINEEKVRELLSKYDFVSIELESLSLKEQIALFANAKAIASAHGSGLTNIMFCNPGTTVIELISPDYIRHYYWVISHQLGLKHYYLTGEGFSCYPIRQLIYPNPLTEDILVNLNSLEKILKEVGIIEKYLSAKSNLSSVKPTSEEISLQKKGFSAIPLPPPVFMKKGKTKNNLLAMDSEVESPSISLVKVEAKKDRTVADRKMQSTVNPQEAAARFNETAQLYLKQKKFEEAKAACQQALENQPDFAPACKTMGNILEGQGQPKEAWGWYSRAIAIQPDFAEAYTNMGTLYARQKQWQEAISYFQKAIEIKPDLAAAYRNLARAYEKIGQLAAAAETRKRASVLETATDSATNPPVLPEALPPFGSRQVSTENNKNIPPSLGQRRGDLELQQDSNNLEQELDGAFPGERENLANSGENSYSQNQFNPAQTVSHPPLKIQQEYDGINSYSGAMALPTDAILAYKQLGQMLQNQGQAEEAWQWYRKAIAYSPNDPEIYLNLGILYGQQQQWQEAIKCYKKSLNIQPNFAETYRKLATAFTQIGQHEQAADCWYRAYSIEPQKATAEEHMILGNTLLRQNLVSQAISCYCHAIELSPNLKGAYENLGEALKRQGKSRQKQKRLGWQLQEEWGRQNIPLEIIQKAESLRQSASSLIDDVSGVGNLQITRSSDALDKANIVEALRKRFDRMVNEFVNTVALAFNLKNDMPARSYLESSLPEQASSNRLQIGQISYPEKADLYIPETVASYDERQPLVTVEPNLTDTYWNLRETKSDWELGFEDEIPLNPPSIKLPVSGQSLPATLTKGVDNRSNLAPYSLSKTENVVGWEGVKSVEPSFPFATPGRKQQSGVNRPEFDLQRARAFFTKGLFEEAIAECHRALAIKPNMASAYSLLGNALQRMGKLAEAEQSYRQAIALAPDDALTQANLGSLYAQEQHWQEAIPCYQQAIALKPNFAGAYRHLAQAWTRVGKQAEAADCWYQAYSLEPQKVTHNQYLNLGNTLYRQGQLTQAITCYRRAIELNPNYSAAYHNLGSALKRQGKLEESAVYYQKAQELNGGPIVSGSRKVENRANRQQSAAGLNGRSSLPEVNPEDVLTSQQPVERKGRAGVVEEGNPPQPPLEREENLRGENLGNASQPALERGENLENAPLPAFARSGANGESYLEAAKGYLQQQQWDEAIAALKLAVKMQPQAEAYLIMGQAWQGKNEPEEAIGCYQKAIELDPDLRDAYQSLVEVLQHVGRYQEAEELSYNALIQHPTWSNAEGFCTLGKNLQAEGKTEKSAACYRQAIELNPQLWEAYLGLGQISSSQQQWEEAVGYYRSGVELNSESILSYYGLGQALAERGDWQGAIASYQKVIELDSNLGQTQAEEKIEIWEIYNHLGDGFQELGQIEEAVQAYRKAIELAEN